MAALRNKQKYPELWYFDGMFVQGLIIIYPNKKNADTYYSDSNKWEKTVDSRKIAERSHLYNFICELK